MSPQLLVAPSLLAADFTRLGKEIRAIEAADADWLSKAMRAEPRASIADLMID